MKVRTSVSVTAAQYYRHLCREAVKDIRKASGKNVTLQELEEGYMYVRKITYGKRPVDIRMKVGPLIENRLFCVSYETEETKGSYSYDFSEDSTGTAVTYSEDTEYKEQTVGNYFGSLIKKMRTKATQMKILRNIEMTETYIQNHEGE